MRVPARLRWPVLGVLACVGAGAVEGVVIIAAVTRTNPHWDVFIPANRVAMFTCAACISFAVAGLVMRPRARLAAMLAGAALLALLGLLYTLFSEVLLRIPAG